MLAFTALWLVSLMLPAIYTNEGPYYGYLLLFIGWMGALIGSPAWFANPLWLLAVVLAKSKPQWASVFGVVGLALAATALLLRNAPVSGGAMAPMTLGPGFWVWIASAAPLLAAIASAYPSARRGAA